MDKLAIVIPCYNESRTIAKVIRDCYAHSRKYDAQIYVYDNNSDDGTDVIAKSAGAVVRYENRQGKGNVVRRMFQEIDADCYIIIDGDDTYPAEDIEKMAQCVLDDGVDMVIGDRLSSTYFNENTRPFHNIGNTVVRRMINSIFKCDIKDVMTGFRAMSYQFVKSFPALSKGFEIETEMTIHAIDKNMNLKNVVIDYRDRPEHSYSKLNTCRDGCKVLRMILRLFQNYKPYGFFGSIALALCLIAFAVLVPLVAVPYIQTGQVLNFPTLIVCGFCVIAAVNSYFSGLILSTMAQRGRQEFEFRLHVIKMMQAGGTPSGDGRMSRAMEPAYLQKVIDH